MLTTTTATINIVINQFRSLGSVFPIDATMSMPPPPIPGISLNEENITITLTGQVQLTFSLSNPQYVLLGVAFSAYDPIHHQTDIGTGEFPLVTITRSLSTGSTLTVLDNGTNPIRYDYMILVQNASNGSIGIIDPGIRNQPN